MSDLQPVDVMTKRFVDAAAALATELSDLLAATDAEAHAMLQAAIGAGHPVALSLVTGIAGGACIQLDLVNGAGERCTVMTISARGGARH